MTKDKDTLALEDQNMYKLVRQIETISDDIWKIKENTEKIRKDIGKQIAKINNNLGSIAYELKHQRVDIKDLTVRCNNVIEIHEEEENQNNFLAEESTYNENEEPEIPF